MFFQFENQRQRPKTGQQVVKEKVHVVVFPVKENTFLPNLLETVLI